MLARRLAPAKGPNSLAIRRAVFVNPPIGWVLAPNVQSAKGHGIPNIRHSQAIIFRGNYNAGSGEGDSYYQIGLNCHQLERD
jgi:hypothetical protein